MIGRILLINQKHAVQPISVFSVARATLHPNDDAKYYFKTLTLSPSAMDSCWNNPQCMQQAIAALHPICHNNAQPAANCFLHISREWSYPDTAELYRVFCARLLEEWKEKQSFSLLVKEEVVRKRETHYCHHLGEVSDCEDDFDEILDVDEQVDLLTQH